MIFELGHKIPDQEVSYTS